MHFGIMKGTFQVKGNGTACKTDHSFEDKIMLQFIFKAIHATKLKMNERYKNKNVKLKDNRRQFFIILKFFLQKTDYPEAIKDEQLNYKITSNFDMTNVITYKIKRLGLITRL